MLMPKHEGYRGAAAREAAGAAAREAAKRTPQSIITPPLPDVSECDAMLEKIKCSDIDQKAEPIFTHCINLFAKKIKKFDGNFDGELCEKQFKSPKY